MKLETVKSFILVILIGISLLLSYTLWSYQPNSNNAISEEIVDTVPSIGGRDDESKRTLVQPTNIIFHKEGSHYDYINPMDREQLYEEIQNWVITDYASGSSRTGDVETNTGIEIIFNGDVPMDMLNSLFTFADEEIYFPSWSMEKMFIYFVPESKSLHLEFATNENDQIQTAAINNPNAFDRLWEIYSAVDSEELREYIQIGEGAEAFYFPAGEVRLPTYTITPNQIDPDTFVNILFNNPSVVRKTNSQSFGETYFTDSRQMRVHADRKRMEYINHVSTASANVEESVEFTKTDLLDRTIEYINGHSGWTDDYRIKRVNMQSNWVRFQLYYDGYPVFNNNKLATIEQEWSVQQNTLYLAEYDRPLYSFESVFEFWEVDSLMSGYELLEYIENNTDKTISELEDIKVGYELSFRDDDSSSEYIELIPAWYIKENNVWQKVDIGTDLSLEGVG